MLSNYIPNSIRLRFECDLINRVYVTTKSASDKNDDMAIVSAIIAMAQALGFQVLAEGTEREEQIEFLKQKGCTMYQGYFKSPPVPAEAFEKLL